MEIPDLWQDILRKLKASKSDSALSNRKQALIPQGAEVIPNPTGTAPGIIWSPKPDFTILTFPGVPSELKLMWSNSAVPWLRKHRESQEIYLSKILVQLFFLYLMLLDRQLVDSF